jgi:hypothetical protein
MESTTANSAANLKSPSQTALQNVSGHDVSRVEKDFYFKSSSTS